MNKSSDQDIVDLTSAGFFADPYEVYKGLRLDNPVAPVKSGGYLLTRHQDIYDVLFDARFGNAPSRFSALRPQNRAKYVAADLASNIVPFLDKPDHTRPRRILAKAFHPAFKEFNDELRDIAQEYAEKFKALGRCEIIHSIAEPYALESMCRFLGVPATDRDFLKPLSEAFFYLFAPLSDPKKFMTLNQDMVVFREYFLKEVQKARAEKTQQGLISRMIMTDHDGAFLTDQEIADHCILLFADGVENIQFAIGNMMSLLDHYLDDLSALTDDGYLKKVMGEALRINPPAQLVPRIVKEEVTLHDVVLKPNTAVFLALGSANHDETVFENPEEFNPDRELNKLLSFGAGVHSCIGGMFGTAQVSLMVQALAACDITVESKLADLTYHHRFGHRWPTSVVLSCV